MQFNNYSSSAIKCSCFQNYRGTCIIINHIKASNYITNLTVNFPSELNVCLNEYSPSSQSCALLAAIHVYPFDDNVTDPNPHPEVQTQGKVFPST
jgi:hypothetical protein